MAVENQAETIFHEARKLAGDERSAFLDRACANDAALRDKINGLLRADALAGDFLDSRVESAEAAGGQDSHDAASEQSAPLAEKPGSRIGPYKLIQSIGEGGFGTVFLAEQEQPVRRKVALKIIKLGMDTRQVVARFEQERQALALMDHPNIAKVFDAGATDTGRPYFVMELCIGESITDYCDQHQLTISQRLELFVQVCLAVQHAHQKGLIHRDIKPSNVLVSTLDGRPSAKVIDFGIAKATSSKLTEKTLFTAHRQLIGTPEYMSPEQAEGSLDIDTRTDVYALGVVLYELLTGDTPFDPKQLRSAAYAEIQRIIREDDPPTPSTRLSQNTDTIASVAASRQTEPKRLGKTVRGELDWIVMKALDKSRQRRYDSAVALAQDVQRYLSGDPVIAAPLSKSYRVRKFVARNKGKVSAAAAVAGALLIGVVAFAWQARIARHQRDRAILAEAQSEKRAADLKQVAEFQAKMLSQIDTTNAGVQLMAGIRSRFADVLAALHVTEPERKTRIDTFERELVQVNATDTAIDMIDRIILKPAISAVDSQFKDQPLVDASLRDTVSEIYRTLGGYDDAEKLEAAALATRRRVLGNDAPLTLRSVNNLASILKAQDRLPEAEKLFREAIEGDTRALGADDAETLNAMRNLGNLYCQQAKFTEAEALLRTATEKFRRVLGNDDRDTLIAINSLGNLLASQGKFAETEPLWREVYERGTRALGANDPDVLVWIFNLGSLIQEQGRASEAEPYFREALEKYRRVRGEDHPNTIRAFSGLAFNLSTQSKYAEAEPLFRTAVEKARRTLGPSSADAIEYTGRLGGMLMYIGKLDEAEPQLRETFDAQRQSLGDSHPSTLKSQALYAKLCIRRGDVAKGEALLRDSVEKSEKVLGADHPQTLIQMADLGNALYDENKYSEAEPIVRKLLEAYRRTSDSSRYELLIEQNVYALILQRQGKLTEAEPIFRDALDKFRASKGNDNLDTVRTIANLASLLRAERKFAEAEPLYREAFASYVRLKGNNYRGAVEVRVRLGETLVGLNRFADAETEMLAAQQSMEKTPDVFRKSHSPALKSLVDLYDAWDKADPGKGFAAKAVEWKTKLDALGATTQPTTALSKP